MDIKFWSSGFMFWNVLLLVYGMGFFVFGTYLRLHSPVYTDLSGEEMSTSIAFLLMIMTITFCTVALLGVRAYLEHHPDSFKSYYVALTSVVFAQIIIILLILAFAHKIKDMIGRDLAIVIKEKYGKERSVTNSIDYIQSKYQCCGAGDYQDYAESFYRWTLSSKDRSESRFLPKSCCLNPRESECNRVAIIKEFDVFYWEVGSNIIHTKGCLYQLQNVFVEESLPYLVGNFIAIFILQIMAISFAFYMETKIYEEISGNLLLSPQTSNLSPSLITNTAAIDQSSPYTNVNNVVKVTTTNEALRQSTVIKGATGVGANSAQHLNTDQTKLLLNYMKLHPELTLADTVLQPQQLPVFQPSPYITLQQPNQITNPTIPAIQNSPILLHMISQPNEDQMVKLNIVSGGTSKHATDISRAPTLPVISEGVSVESLPNLKDYPTKSGINLKAGDDLMKGNVEEKTKIVESKQ